MQISKSGFANYKREAEKYFANPNAYDDVSALESRKGEYNEPFREMIRKVHAYSAEKCSLDKIKDPRFKLWFKRQSARNRFQSKVIRHMEGFFYVGSVFELADGCSIGCDFCCLDAKRLSAVYRYTPKNALKWREMLQIMKDILGDFAASGVCYFATEPFDNPDYEKFLKDFHDIYGYLPQTTTAAADRDVRRTRAFLESLGEEELAHAAVRFSVTSLEQLRKIHGSFTPEELYYVEVLTNNPESINAYSKTGRSVRLSDEMNDKNFLDVTNICVCGFVTNMPRQTVKLVAAYRPSERYPLGMRILEEQSFDGTEAYCEALLGMIKRWMPDEMPTGKPLYLSDFLTSQRLGYRFKIQGDKISRSVTASEAEQKGFRLLIDENVPVDEILSAVAMTELERTRFKENVKLFYESGYLEERKEKYGMEQ